MILTAYIHLLLSLIIALSCEAGVQKQLKAHTVKVMLASSASVATTELRRLTVFVSDHNTTASALGRALPRLRACLQADLLQRVEFRSATTDGLFSTGGV